MDYKEFAERIRHIPVSDKLEYEPAVFWLHRERLPLGLVSLGGEKSLVIRIPESAENRYGRNVPVIAIARAAFSGNEEVTDIVLPPSIDRLPAGAFAGCSSLRRITIPRAVKRIPEGTFAGCRSLEDIYYEGTREEWKKIDIVHQRHEIEFGKVLPGQPVQEILAERWINIPGNEPIFSANIHFRCPLGGTPPAFKIFAAGKEMTEHFRTL